MEASPVQLDKTKLRELLEDVQGQTRADVLHHLEVTAAAGRRFAVRTSGERSTLKLSLLATVSADDRSIRVALKAEQASIVGYGWHPKGKAIAVNEIFTLADGRTILFDAGARTGGWYEPSHVPILRDLPYVGELFTWHTFTKEEDRVLILVKPRVLRR